MSPKQLDSVLKYYCGLNFALATLALLAFATEPPRPSRLCRMDPAEKEKVLKALSALGVDAESLGSFDDEALQRLSTAKYNTLGILRSARPESLEVLLAPAHGLVDCILKAQGARGGPAS